MYVQSWPKSIVAAAAAAGLSLTAPSVALADPSKADVTISLTSSPGQPGQSSAGNTFRVTARVPVACWVRPDTTLIAQPGGAGGVLEACNNPGGFTVTANYRPLRATEKAQMVYDDRPFDLAKSGAQVLRRSSMATIKRVNYRFGDVELDEPLVLSLTIQPI